MMAHINLLLLVAVQLFVGSPAGNLGFLKFRNASKSLSLPSGNATGASLLQKDGSSAQKGKDVGDDEAERSEDTNSGSLDEESLVDAGSDMALYGNGGGEEGSDLALYGGEQSMLEVSSNKAPNAELSATVLENSSVDSDAVTTADLAGADDDDIDDAIDNDEADDEDNADDEDVGETENAKEGRVADDSSDSVEKVDKDETNQGDEPSLLQDSGSDTDVEDTEDSGAESDADAENTSEEGSDNEGESLLEIQGQEDGDYDQTEGTDDESSAREDMETAFEAEQDKELEENPFGAALIQEGKVAENTADEPGDLADAELEKIQLAEDLEVDSNQDDESEEVKLEEDAWTERGAMLGVTD